MINGVHKLIIDYLNCAKYVCGILSDSTDGKYPLLEAKVVKLLPKEGVVEGISYSFHGIGCYFEFEGGHIDIDFGPDNRFDGFDEFRLLDFLKSFNKERQESYQIDNDDEFKGQFAALVDRAVIWKPNWPPAEHLYYIR